MEDELKDVRMKNSSEGLKGVPTRFDSTINVNDITDTTPLNN